MFDGEIKIGQQNNSAEKYTQYSNKVVSNSAQILRNVGVPIPIGQSEEKDDSQKGLVVEHQKQPQAELPTEEPVAKEEKSDLNQGRANSDEEKTDLNQGNATKSNNKTKEPDQKRKSLTDTTNTVNNAYKSLVAKGNVLSSKNSLTSKEASGRLSISGLVDTMEDIDDAGQRHIDELTEEYPEGGNLNGTVYTAYTTSKGSSTTSFQAAVSNTWQNKPKTFVIGASASFNYERSKTTTDPFDIDLSDDEAEQLAEEVQQVAKQEPGTEALTNLDLPEPETTIDIQKSGNITIHARYSDDKCVYGAAASSNFYANGTQLHDQNISVLHKSTGLAGDLTRRTTISKDDMGKNVVNTDIRLKASIVSRNGNPFDEDPEEVPEEDNKLTALPETDTKTIADTDADTDTDTNTDTDTDTDTEERQEFEDLRNTTPKGQELREQVENDKKELRKKIKDGTGFNLDFEYNDSDCGIIAEYGMKLIDKKNNTRLLIAPVLGAYDHTTATEEESESLKLTTGIVFEGSKKFGDGSTLNGDLTLTNNRVFASGRAPEDTRYTTLNLYYGNPRKKFYTNLDAGIIKTNDISMTYAQLNALLKTKNITWGLQAGATNLNSFDSSDTSWEIGLKCAIDLNY